MKEKYIKPFVSKYFFVSLLLTIPFLLYLSYKTSLGSTTKTGVEPPPSSTDPGLKIRPGYSTYDSYIQRQLNKTLNPKLRKIWTTRDWNRKIQVFSGFFNDLKQKNLLTDSSRALCIGARMGQEVEALKRVGVSDSIGIDLVPSLPLVMKGDFHHQPFDDEIFDFEFSNVFDHALYPHKFVDEIQRTLKPGGICVLHVALSRRSDKYSANDLFSVEPLKKLFKKSELVHVRTVDGFGLDTEVVFRKNK
ncbi:S-adenosyl-L-methionine-dependent methyltransferase superfamily protein [Abeliophyllum distichum]|uniref:S-adenosyl-L-methionine-dependent methyltransferase superfamily protein n=1 Tax=Abeliophyllum distichum TaxID=126358 RepID=A0ABD1U3R7_9LAMI